MVMMPITPSLQTYQIGDVDPMPIPSDICRSHTNHLGSISRPLGDVSRRKGRKDQRNEKRCQRRKNNRPPSAGKNEISSSPDIKMRGRNTTIVVAVTSQSPGSLQRCLRLQPLDWNRLPATINRLTTTIALSTTIPTASISPIKVSKLGCPK